ncbi:MAG: (d)CMP kinase [Deltaproteobacteria bacterium]|nr:(d)CMP kinase [Deltaproteobacteria bacterium]
MKKLLITIDGPAGAGKTTVSRSLADRLGYRYIDTGALYRGIALAAKNRGVDPQDDKNLKLLCKDIDLNFVKQDKGLGLFLDGEDISDRIRTPEITMMASAVSARPVVREFLLGLQKDLGREKAAVFEGRDMGTVVFPEADLKFFLDASTRTRARRRYEEQKSKNSQTLDEVEQDIQLRDHNDSTRDVAPLKPAEDAIVIDSTEMKVDDVVDFMVSHIG